MMLKPALRPPLRAPMRGATTLREGGGVLASGFAYDIDQNGNPVVDVNGARSYSAVADDGTRSLKQIAASKGIRFGATTPETFRGTVDAAMIAFFNAECDVFVPGVECEGTRIQNVEGVFTFTEVETLILQAIAAGKTLVWSHLFYPEHDMAWVNTGTVTAGNYQAKIDAHVAAVAAFLQTSDGAGGTYLDHFTRINVTNEIIDGNLTNPNGYRSNAWYTAAGPAYVAYMFQSARAAWPTKTLSIGQDEQESIPLGDSYYTQEIANYQAMLTEQVQTYHAPIDAFDLQGHFLCDRGWQPGVTKAMLDYVTGTLGLKLVIGELDMRAATLLASISASDYAERQMRRIYQYLSFALPYVKRGGADLVTWYLSDAFNQTSGTWGAGETPFMFDAAYARKPFYTAVRAALINLE